LISIHHDNRNWPFSHPSSESKERALERMMKEYSQIAEHDNVESEAIEEPAEAQTTHKIHHNRKSAVLQNSRNFIQ
jgi:hypothetical protein